MHIDFTKLDLNAALAGKLSPAMHMLIFGPGLIPLPPGGPPPKESTKEDYQVTVNGQIIAFRTYLDKNWGVRRMVYASDLNGDPPKYRKLARLIMEFLIQRRLRADELVHHRNGCEFDDRPENLQIVTPAQHRAIHAAIVRALRAYRGWVRIDLPGGTWEKRCPGCNQIKPAKDYYVWPDTGLARFARCRVCTSRGNTVWRRRARERKRGLPVKRRMSAPASTSIRTMSRRPRSS